MMMKQLVILANKYPNEFDPNINVFTQQTAWTFADLGYECVVVCPSAVNLNKTNRKLPLETVEMTEQGNNVRIVRPRYLSMGQRPGPLNKQRVSFTVSNYVGAANKALRDFSIDPALFFGEFLCPCGVAAAKLSKTTGVPSFFQSGEGLYFGDRYFGNDGLAKVFDSLCGVVAVSQNNRDYLLHAGVVKPKQVLISPNGCRGDRFYPRDKKASRRLLGWDENAFVVGMVGRLETEKGPLRLKQAAESLDAVYFACAGKGPQDPSCERCLNAGPVDNSELPIFLSALDAFVLPTQIEGCCTAIVEAISCGLPIISADRSFNYDICGDDNSILVDPHDINAIATAIARLRDDGELRARLAQGSLDRAPRLELRKRVASIANWMDMMTNGALATCKVGAVNV